MRVKGDLKLEVDEQGLAASVTIVPRDAGDELSAERLLAALGRKGIRAGINHGAIEDAFKTLARKADGPVTFVAAMGTPPRPPEPERVDFEKLPIPGRLASLSRGVLARASPPVGFRLREETVRRQKKVLKKPSLPFLPAQEDVQVVVEKRTVREEVPIDPAVLGTGFVARGALVAKIQPGKPGREGKNVFGRFIPPPRADQSGFLFCEGLSRAGNEARATATGFLRRGATWCDVVPFQDHVVKVSASADKSACLLSFEPGDPAVPLPAADEILSQAEELGFPSGGLLDAGAIEALLRESAASRTAIHDRSLSTRVEGLAEVTVSPDRLHATLTLRKARGGGRPLTLAGVADAIRLSKVRRYDLESVRRDVQAFFKSDDAELLDYDLAAGKAPGKGREGEVSWLIKFFAPDEARSIVAISKVRADLLAGVSSLEEFPLENVDSIAQVAAEAKVLRIVPGSTGSAGVDVFGASVPGLPGWTPEVRVFEGLELRRDVVVAVEPGILEKGSIGMTILLRVRSHRDASLEVTISDDRMKGFLSFIPARGTGMPIDVGGVRSAMAVGGIVRGIMEERFHRVLDAIAQGKPFSNVLVAQGKEPDPAHRNLVTFHIRLATGKAVAFREDGTADFRAQDRITHVAKGARIASVKPPPVEVLDAWDVTGKPIHPVPDASNSLQAGRGVSTARQKDGSLEFFAQVDGELVRNGPLIAVEPVHTVDGDVDMGSGNVNFPGIVRVRGSVNGGFRVMAEGDIEIEETVEAAAVSTPGSILIGQGIKGDGKARLQAGRSIVAPFAEQASLRAVDTVHLRGACLRCDVVCGQLLLDSEKDSLVGGEVKARHGVIVQNLGSPGGMKTVVCFGQDFAVKEEMDRLEGEIATFEKRLADLEAVVKELQKQARPGRPADPATLSRIRAEKDEVVTERDQRRFRRDELASAFDAYCPSEIFVRGTLYPGVLLESHGTHWETRTEKNRVTLVYDQKQGRIVERA